MDELPVELLHRICSFGNTQTISTFRLLNRKCAAVGSEYLMPEATVYFARESFDKARAIAQSPVAKSVRSVLFQAARLQHIPDYETWDKVRSDPDGNRKADTFLYGSPSESPDMWETPRGRRRRNRDHNRAANMRRGIYSKAELKAAHQKFQAAYADQERMEREKDAAKAFRALFQGCPKLDSVTMSMGHNLCLTTSTRVATFRRGMVYPFHDQPVWHTGAHALQSLLIGAQAAKRPLRSLSVQPISHAFFAMPPYIAPRISRAIACLEEVHIGLCGVFHDENVETMPEDLNFMLNELGDMRISNFLAQAVHLHTLSITFPRDIDTGRHPELEILVGDTLWPKLQALGLDEIQCTEEKLLEVIFKHKSTLERLHLSEVYFTHGDPNHFFQVIAGNLPSLGSVRLRGAFKTTHGNGIEVTSVHERGDGRVSKFTRAMENYVVEGGSMPDPEDPQLLEGSSEESNSEGQSPTSG